MDAIDDLLLDWYEWSQGFNLGISYQAFDSTCAQYRSSRQWMDYDDLDAEVEWQRKKSIGKTLEPMILELDLRARIAINLACRNMWVGARVWTSPRISDLQSEYARAKALLCPKLVSAGLIDRTICMT